MPINIGKDEQGCFAQWGNQGHKYYYKCGNVGAREEAKKKALAQGVAIGEFAEQRISFDFDDVLNKASVREIAKRYIDRKVPVYVISARHHESNMWPTTDELGIPRTRVFATGSNKEKVQKVLDLKITKHYDNNESVIKTLGGIGELVKLSIHERFAAVIKFLRNDNSGIK